MKLFNAKIIKEKFDRIYGFAIRFCGIDISVSTVWWLNDFALFDLRMFREGLLGVYFQSLFLIIYIGYNEVLWTTEKEVN